MDRGELYIGNHYEKSFNRCFSVLDKERADKCGKVNDVMGGALFIMVHNVP